MYGILNVSRTGMSATQNKINVISNNVVNANTTGYKKLEVGFEDLLRNGISKERYPVNADNTTVGTGVKSTTELRNFTQGSLRNSGIVTNLAIDGEGFFRVIKSDNTYAYTRNGEFSIDGNGKIVDDSGNILDIQFINGKNYDNSGIQENNFSVNKKGEVYVNDERIGNINLYKATGDNDFLSTGNNLFTINDGAQVIQANGDIHQGYIEMSNVNTAQEFTDLISMQRAFQLNSKGFSVADEMWSMINNLQSR